MKLVTFMTLVLGLVALACGLIRNHDSVHLDNEVLIGNSSATPKPLNHSSVAVNGHNAPSLGAVHVAGFDPNDVASAEDYEKFRVKGNFLACLSRGTDAEAGQQWPDPLNRSPKSARSAWTGDLSGK